MKLKEFVLVVSSDISILPVREYREIVSKVTIYHPTRPYVGLNWRMAWHALCRFVCVYLVGIETSLLNENKRGDISIKENLGAFVQLLLQRKSHKCYSYSCPTYGYFLTDFTSMSPIYMTCTVPVVMNTVLFTLNYGCKGHLKLVE
jgi:hypothetical protein